MKTLSWSRWWSRTGENARPVLRKKPRPRRLQLEALEDRTLLSGTPQLLADINPGAASSNPSQMVTIGTESYFAANDGTHGNELWKTDGTAAGTRMVADINPGSGSSNPTYLTNVNGELFFRANDGTHGTQLWKSDGTAAGTSMVADINPTGSSNPYNLTNVNGTLFFSANDGTHGYELWKSDGTAAGTSMVADINPSGSSDPSNLTNVNGELFFSADDGQQGDQLWKSDGTAAGTIMVKEIYLSAVGAGSFPSNLTNVNGTLFFSAYDGTNGSQLWKSDGTTAGTVSLTGWVSPGDLKNVNGELYFSANDGTHGYQLWKSDGTAAGTGMVADINPSGSSYPSNLTNVNGTLFFSANDGTHGTELWKSDGTSAGTTMVKDINPGTTTIWYFKGSYGTYTNNVTTQGSYPNQLTNVNGTLYFSANDGTHGYELWKSDGTAAGTTLVQDIYPGTRTASYTYYGYYGGVETETATLPNSSYPSSLTNLNGTLLFAANDDSHGNELWEVPPGPSLAVSAVTTTPTAGQADTFRITARNADGTPDTTLNGAVAITSSDPKAILPTSVTLTNGTAQFNATFETAGPQTITATYAQTPTDQGTENDIVVQAASASSFTLTGFPSPATVGTAGSFTVTAYDPYGNVATGYSGTVHFTSSDPNALLPADTTLANGVGPFSATLETLGTNQSITATDTKDSSLTATESGIEVIPFASITGPSAGYLNQTLTYTLGAGADPAGTVFNVNWGDGTSVQTTATSVSHTYSTSANYTIRVIATAAGLSSTPATQAVDLVPVTVAVEADAALSGQQVLVIDSTASNANIVLGNGTGNGVTLSFDGNYVGNLQPTNGLPFALVVLSDEQGSNDVLNASQLSTSAVLVGGVGNEVLYGGSGRDLLIAGTGSATLKAGSGDTILIGGTTSYDSNVTALDYIMAEWDSSASYSTRVKQLSGNQTGGLNGKYLLNSTTVFDNNAVDLLYGGSGMDWFFAHTKGTNVDPVYNLRKGEVVTSI